MRFIVEFQDETYQVVSQREGESLMKAFAESDKIFFRGALFNARFIRAIKPIRKPWFKNEFIQQETRKELANPEEKAYINANPPPSLTD